MDLFYLPFVTLKMSFLTPLNSVYGIIWHNLYFGHNSNIKIRPVNFSTEHKNMLSNLHAVVTKGYLAISERYDKLLTSLRTAWAEELSLDKKQTSYDDLLDSLRLALNAYKFE